MADYATLTRPTGLRQICFELASTPSKNRLGGRMLIDWRVAAGAAVLCTGVLLTCIETNAQAIPKEVAARVEMHTIPSLTLSDRQFLTGDANGAQPVTMAGELKIAQGIGKLPVVVLMHGSGGINPAMDAWT